MNIHPDFEELLRLLEEHGVEYMIVGGYAVAYHGYPRFTKDIDLFFRLTGENALHLRSALVEFGFCEEDLPLEAFMTAGNVLTFGVVPTRIDLMNKIDGVTYDEARPNVVRGRYGDVKVSFISLADLLRNKKATPRAKDKGDVEELTQQG
jgi:hypothetical protein